MGSAIRKWLWQAWVGELRPGHDLGSTQQARLQQLPDLEMYSARRAHAEHCVSLVLQPHCAYHVKQQHRAM